MKHFTTKLISVLLLVFLLLPLTVFSVAAEDEEDEGIKNIAPLGEAYASTIKNPAWTPAEAINDEDVILETWKGWEPLYPTVPAGATGLSGEYCGVKFDGFYKIYGAKLDLRNADTQDITYTVQALIMGSWVDIYELHDHDFEGKADLANGNRFSIECTFDAPVTTNNIRLLCSDYAKGFGGGDELLFPYVYEFYLYGEEGNPPSVVVPEGYFITPNVALAGQVFATSASVGNWPALIVDSNNNDSPWKAAADDVNASVGVTLSEAVPASEISLDFGSGTAAIPYEVFVVCADGNEISVYNDTVTDGVTSIVLEEDLEIVEVAVVYGEAGAQLKELQVLSSYNAANGGAFVATSEAEGFGAASINTADGLWKAGAEDAAASVALTLTEATFTSQITLTFGENPAALPYTVSVLCESGTVVHFTDGIASAEPAVLDLAEIVKTGDFVTGVTVTYEGAGAQLAGIYVHADNFAFAVSEEPSDEYKQSCAKGNLAVLGTPYASSNFPTFSQVSYINDGLIKSKNPSWYGYGFDVPAHCGVTFDRTYTVSKVALTFDFIEPKGSAIMYFDIQAKVDGEYVTLASGRSYDSSFNYQPVFTFDAVTTDDIRIVFTKNGGIFPSLRELEVYSETEVPMAYMGYPTNYPIGGRAPTTYADDPDANIVYDTTTRNFNPPMRGSEEAAPMLMLLSNGSSDTTPADSASDTTPVDSSSTADTTPAPAPEPAEPAPFNATPWITTAIVFVLCGAVVVGYVLVKKKKA